MSRVYGRVSEGSERRIVRDAVDGLLRPGPGEAILEPGCGAGQVLVALAERVGPTGQICGLDVSAGMLAATARRVAAARRLTARVNLVRGDAAALPIGDGQFDGVLMSFALEFFADEEVPKVLGEAHRVLRTSGRLCLASMSSTGGNAAMERAYGWSHRRFPAFVDCRPIDAASWIDRADFDVIERRSTRMWGLAVDLVLARPRR